MEMVRQFPALPSTPAVELRIHINDQHTNFQSEKLQIINGNKLLYPCSQFLIWVESERDSKKTFILDSHLPSY
jgi:hypothetical protein